MKTVAVASALALAVCLGSAGVWAQKQTTSHADKALANASSKQDLPVDLAKATRLAYANACFSCHAAHRKLIGPSFDEIAKRYHADESAAAKLAIKIKKGSAGVWGAIPMPSHSRLSDADAKLLGQWVMAGAPDQR